MKRAGADRDAGAIRDLAPRVAAPILRNERGRQSRLIRKIVGAAEPREDCMVFLTAGQYSPWSSDVAMRNS